MNSQLFAMACCTWPWLKTYWQATTPLIDRPLRVTWRRFSNRPYH